MAAYRRKDWNQQNTDGQQGMLHKISFGAFSMKHQHLWVTGSNTCPATTSEHLHNLRLCRDTLCLLCFQHEYEAVNLRTINLCPVHQTYKQYSCARCCTDYSWWCDVLTFHQGWSWCGWLCCGSGRCQSHFCSSDCTATLHPLFHNDDRLISIVILCHCGHYGY